jgi:uncharacterized protein
LLEFQYLEKLIRLAQAEYNRVDYIWHGGEPLLCGLNYFEKVLEFQEKYRQPGSVIQNSIQTNGSLITDEYIIFFKDNKFDISISFDGPGIFNSLRHNTKNVINIIEKLQNASVNLATISVIHSLNVEHQIEMYEYFKSKKLPMKFNPIFQDGSAIVNQQYLLEPEQYIRSLKSFYNYWLTDKNAVPVDPINQYLSLVLRGRGIDCIYGSCLTHWIGIDHNGDIFPCGRSYPKEYKLINISEIIYLHEAFETPSFKNIISQAIIRRNKCQNTCKYFGICYGGCNNNALLEHRNMQDNGGFLCEVLQEMFVYVSDSVQRILASPEGRETYNNIILDAIEKFKIGERRKD